MDYLKIAIMSLNEAKNIQDGLKSRGVDVQLNHNDETCSRGCSVTVEVHAKKTDLPIIKAYLDENFAKSLEGHEVDMKTLNSVFDPAKEKAICPACGFEFSTDSKACPDCGLNLGI